MWLLADLKTRQGCCSASFPVLKQCAYPINHSIQHTCHRTVHDYRAGNRKQLRAQSQYKALCLCQVRTNHFLTQCKALNPYLGCCYQILLSVFNILLHKFNVFPAPAANRSIGISPSRLHCGRTANYGSIIIPLLSRRVTWEPPGFQCSCFCLPDRWIAAIQQRMYWSQTLCFSRYMA